MKYLFLTICLVLSFTAFAGPNPVKQTPYTTNDASLLPPVPTLITTNGNNGTAQGVPIPNTNGFLQVTGPSTVIANPNVVTNQVNLLLAGALGGTNDDTLVIQGLINKLSLNGGAVIFPATNFTVYGTINLTNNVSLIGQGGRLSLATNVVNASLIYINTNVNNLVISGMILDGGFYGTNLGYDGTTLASWAQGGGNATMPTRTARGRTAITYNACATNVAITASIFGWDTGLKPFSIVPSTATMSQPHTTINYCELYSNGVAIDIVSSAGADVEYGIYYGLQIHGNTTGLHLKASNNKFEGDVFTRNFGAVFCEGTGDNGVHSSFTDCTLNHGQGIDLVCSNCNDYLRFDDIKFYAGNNNFLINCSGVSFVGCDMGTGGRIFNGNFDGNATGPNYFIAGHWTSPNTAANFIYDFATASAVNTPAGQFQHFLNNGSAAGDNDGFVLPLNSFIIASNLTSVVGGQFTGNGLGLTNLTWPTNFALPAVVPGKVVKWFSNGWEYNITAQHPNGVLISAP